MATLSSRRGGTSSAIPPRVTPQPRSTDRHKTKTMTLRLKAAGFKPHPNPHKADGDGAEQYTFKALADAEMPNAMGPNFMNDWMKVNPREQRLNGPIMKAIEDTWRDNPTEFFRVNRGLVISAESAKFDNEKGIVELVFSDPRKHGVLDGGHTLRKIVDDLIPITYGGQAAAADDDTDDHQEELAIDDEDEDEEEVADSVDEHEEIHDRYLSCEVWTGLSLDQVALLSQGRNTSRTVPPYAIMEIKGEFQPLKAAIAACNKDYAEKIVAFKPNEHVEGLEEFKPVSVLDVLQLLMALDINHSDSNTHPVEAYKNKSFAAKYYAERNEEYRKMFPIVGNILELFDMLREVVPEAYDDANARPRRWSKVLAGEGEPVDTRLVEPLYFLNTTGQKKVMRAPNAVFFPIFSAFRANLKEVGGKYQWWDGESPTDWPRDVFHTACQRLALKVAKAVKDKDKLNAVGRDQQVWATCYETLNGFLFESGRKKGQVPQRD